MGYVTYKLTNLFKSKEEINREARLEFKRQKRSFEKYLVDIDAATKEFERMAIEAERSGNHKNAMACAGFILKLRNTRVRVQGILQRFEMMYQMTRMGSMMSGFADCCAKMGFKLKSDINLKKVMKNSAEMEKSLNLLDEMSEEMNSIFDSIDEGMGVGNEQFSNALPDDPEAAKTLDALIGRATAVTYAPSQGGGQQESKNDEDELKKLMESLGGKA